MSNGTSPIPDNSIDENRDLQVFDSSIRDDAIPAPLSSEMIDGSSPEQHLPRGSVLVWLDANIDESDNSFRNSMSCLRRVTHDISIFTNPEPCIKFLNQTNDVKVIMIVSGVLGEKVIPEVHPMEKLDSIYLFCGNKAYHEQWTKGWPKVKGIFVLINSLCEALKKSTDQVDYEPMSISIMSLDAVSTRDLDQLDPSFMYTQLFKEILSQIKYDSYSVMDFINHCRGLYANEERELENITKFEREYCLEKAVYWYTYDCFLYRMMNKALRNQEMSNLIKVGFFIRDLHRQLERLHAKQDEDQQKDSFIVYRGQSLPTTDFEKLQNAPGGLISFNNFLSTSTDHEVSLNFIKSAKPQPDLVSILFEMTVSPSISSTPFSLVAGLSAFKAEKEILFTTHTVFRIGEIRPIGESKLLWRVSLTLTHDNDPHLNAVAQCMRKETDGLTGWHKLGVLLVKVGEYTRAEDVYRELLNRTTADDTERADLTHQLGWSKRKQGNNEEALQYFEKARAIREKFLHKDHLDFIVSHNNIGDAYVGMGDYSKALPHFEKAIEMCEKTLPSDHPQLGNSYNNLGDLYNYTTEYSKALLYYEKALELRKKILPSHHPDLATSNNNIADAYSNIADYTTALPYYKTALEISEKILPANHPNFASFYNNIGMMYDNMGEYKKALSYYEKALQNAGTSPSKNHPTLINAYNNIGSVYYNMGDFSQALPNYEKALDIGLKTLPKNHPNLATFYNNIGLVHCKNGDYPKALSYYEMDRAISEVCLPANHLDLAPSYSSMGLVYFHMGEHSKAISFYDRALGILQNALPTNHPSLAICYTNIGNVYNGMDEHLKALTFHEKALEIRENNVPLNHQTLSISYNNIGSVYKSLKRYSDATLFYERALEAALKSLPEDHPEIQTYKKNLHDVTIAITTTVNLEEESAMGVNR